MLFTLAELEREAIDFDETLPAGSVEFAEDMLQANALHAAGRVDLLREHRGPHEIVKDMRIRASFQTRMEIPCARCLDPVEQALDSSFDLIFRPQGADGQGIDHAISTSETEIGYYGESSLLLEDVLREQILLALPTRILCSPECKGLCPECGRNQNTNSCNCAALPSDPRWLALESIRSHVKS